MRPVTPSGERAPQSGQRFAGTVWDRKTNSEERKGRTRDRPVRTQKVRW